MSALGANKKVLILGSTGMLGQQVCRVFERAGIVVEKFSRAGIDGKRFSFEGQSSDQIIDSLGIEGGEWLINCVGWIPQKRTGLEAEDSVAAFRLNAALPKVLEEVSQRMSIRVLQVVTDCVFEGSNGPYSEDSNQDAADLYGLSKALGEASQPTAMKIRASIVGPDNNSTSGLFSWFLSYSNQGQLTGYENHFWNGVSTLAMSKLFLGIVELNQFAPGTHHWVPRGFVSKLQLLELFRKSLGWGSVEITPGNALLTVDRRLVSVLPARSEDLWKTAGYSDIPRIDFLVQEMVEDFTNHWNPLT